MYEIHGRIRKFQCTECNNVWTPPTSTKFNVDTKKFECVCELPRCSCGAIARPNIMLFNDTGFDTTETTAQEAAFNKFMHKYDKDNTKIAVVEFGAGTAVPTIRMMGEFIHANVEGATLVRVNPAESQGPKGIVSIPKGALAAITEDLVPVEIKKIFFMD